MTDAPTQQAAKHVALTRDGMTIDGQPLGFYVGTEVAIVREGGRTIGVNVTILCDEVTIGAGNLGDVTVRDDTADREVLTIRDPLGNVIRTVDVTPEPPRRWAIGDEHGHVVAYLVEGDGVRRVEWAAGSVGNESDVSAVRRYLEERHSHPNLADDLISDARICGVPPRAWTRARDEGEHIVVVFETAALLLESYGQAQDADQVEEHTLQWSRADLTFLSGGSLHLTTKTDGHDPKRTYDVKA